MEKWQKTAIEKIRDVIQKKGITQQSLVKNAGFGKSHLNEVLNGKRPLTRQFVRRFADHLKMDTDWFYEDRATPDAPSPMPIEKQLDEVAERAAEKVLARKLKPALSPDKQRLIDLVAGLDEEQVKSVLRLAQAMAEENMRSDAVTKKGPSEK